MKSEQRIYKSSMIAGLLDVLIGLIMYITGLHDWYFEHFKVFGVLGIGMFIYGLVHYYYYKKEFNNGKKRKW